MVYNINIKKARGGIGSGVIFLLTGLLFLFILGSIIVSGIIKKNSLDGEAKAINTEWVLHTDSEGNDTYSPVYTYEINGQVYTCKSSTSSSSKSSSKGIVYYDSKNPSSCLTDFDNGTNTVALIFLFMPIIFIVIGANHIKKALKNAKNAKKLSMNGILVKGAPYQIVNTGMAVNNRKIKAFTIIYTFPDGQTKELKSQGIFDHVLSDRDGLCDFVYDPNNYNNYFIDLEINPTGVGSPKILYYNQTQNNNDTISNLNNNTFQNIYEQNTYNSNNYSQDNYNPNNKY